MSQNLVTLAQAKGHLRIPFADEDEDLQRKLDQAEAIVLRRILAGRPSTDTDWIAEVAAWTEDDVPVMIAAAIERQFADLCQFRGDDSGRDRDWSNERLGYLAPGVEALLRSYIDPALA